MNTAIVNAARQYIGLPFSWFGTSPVTGFGCIGLVFRVAADCGEHHEPFPHYLNPARARHLDLCPELQRRLIEIPVEQATSGDVLLMTLGRDRWQHVALVSHTRPLTILHSTPDRGVAEQSINEPIARGLAAVTWADLVFAAFRFHMSTESTRRLQRS